MFVIYILHHKLYILASFTNDGLVVICYFTSMDLIDIDFFSANRGIDDLTCSFLHVIISDYLTPISEEFTGSILE